ncbi:MAG: transcription elongation factor GreA [bacterium]|jgi:transcription elongation factor GreA|nr:transcription elongation factor GreA [bacterium]HRF93961.1 transcription elongation factor GreA [Aggregatilineales bacterium]
MNNPQYLTQEGMDALEKRLRQLIEVRRPQIAERLRQSLEEGGDLTENSEYEDAKNEQAFVEGEIVRLETILSSATLIEDGGKRDRVTPGAMVTLVDQNSKETETFHLVGSAEANPREGKISIESPLGKALMGAKVGDKVKYKAPDGEFVFKIKAIQ